MKLLESDTLTGKLKTQYEALLKEADEEPFFYGASLDPELNRMVVIEEDEVRGCFEFGTTMYEGRNYWRSNRPYVAKDHRGKEVMRRALNQWFEHRRPAIAWIDDDNTASIRLFLGVGFRMEKQMVHKEREGALYRLGHTQLPTFERM